MSQLNVDNIQNRTGSNGGPNFPSGITVAVGQTAYIHGNLQVDGTETIVNTETLNVADKTVGIGSTTNASNTTADGAGIEVFASSSQTGNNKTITWQNSSAAWTFGGGGIVATDAVVGSAVTINSSGVTVTGVVTATSFKGDGSLLTGIDATQIQNGNTSVQTVDTGSDGHVKMTTEGSERLRIGPAGQIGLGGANYGTSGQLLTSAGSGSAPTWTTVSSAPEVSGTANGAIAAGKPVISNADGSISQAKYNYTIKGTVVESSTGQVISVNPYGGQSNAAQIKVGYDSTNDKVLYFWKNTNDSNAGEINVGTITGQSGNNISVGNASRVRNSISKPYAVVWSKTSAVGVALYQYTSGAGIYVKAFTSDGTTLTFGSEVRLCEGSSSDHADISWDASADKFLVVIGNDQGDSNYTNAWVVSHSGTTLTLGTKTLVKNTISSDVSLSYDSDNNRHLLCYADYNDSAKLCGRIITVSGTTPTISAETEGSVNNHYLVQTAYISNGKFITYYNRSNEGYARIVTVGGSNAITFGAESAKINDNALGGIGNDGGDCAYDEVTGKVGVAFRLSSGPNDGGFKLLTLDTSANTITAISSLYYTIGSAIADCSVRYVGGTHNMFVTAFKKSNNHGGSTTFTTADAVTNLTSENYLGLSNSSYTNGQTASIRVSGSTQDNQTGLTPGQNYFVQNDGTLGTTAATPKVYAGTAVSSTKLLVGKESDSPSTSWLKLASFDGSTTGSGNQTIYEDFANQTYRRYKLVFYARSTSSGSGNVDLGLQIKGSSGSWQTSNYRMMEVNFRDTNQNQHITSQSKLRISRYGAFLVDGQYSFFDPADLNNNSPTEHMFGMTNYVQHSAQPGSNADCYQYNIANGGWQGDGNQYVAGIRWNFGGAIATFSWALFAANGWN